MQAQFFVENANIAFALKNINGKIWDKNNERVCVKDMTRVSEGRGGRTAARSCLIPRLRFPGAYPAPLVLFADIYLCQPL